MTNKEIARALNISPTALSFILNNKPGVSERTRTTVIRQINAMGYGHLIKSSEKTAEDLTICFIVYLRHGKILNQHPFFLLLMESIESHARKYGYNIILRTMDSKAPMQEQLDSLIKMNPKGILIFATEMLEEDMAQFSSLPIPCLAVDNAFPYLNINTVSINNQLGTFQAVQYLVQQGHKKIGYLKSSDYICSFAEREQGYREALQHFHLNLNPEYVYKIRYSEEGSFQDFAALLQKNIALPTALVCDDDTIAIGAMRALTLAGYRIPDDISIVGFNDRPNSEITLPPLTSVNVPKVSFGVSAVNGILSMIQEKEAGIFSRSVKTRIGTQLVIRSSVKKIG